ncbi:hypothetical protein FQZ97_839630 [compost metagenome]
MLAILGGVEVAEVGAEHPVADRLAVLEAEVALVIDILQLGVPGADRGAVGVEGVVGAAIVEAVRADQPAGVAQRDETEHGAQFLITGLVAQAGGTQLAALQGQPGDLVGDDAGALIGRRQQADIAEVQHRQHQLLFADLQLGLRQPDLEGRTQTTIVIGRPALIGHRQQAGIDPIRAAVELEPQQADGVDTEADGARGIA